MNIFYILAPLEIKFLVVLPLLPPPHFDAGTATGTNWLDVIHFIKMIWGQKKKQVCFL